MQIADYLRKHDLTASDLARTLGITRSMVSHLIAGRRSPSALLAKEIDRATKGRVAKHELRPDVFDAPRRRAA